MNSEPSVFENTRDACAVLARKTAFAQLTVRHKMDSLTPEQVKHKEEGK